MNTIAHTPTQKALLSLVRERQKNSTLVTVKEAAKKINCSIDEVIDAAEDMCLNINVAGICNGGHAELEKNQYTIEDLNAPDDD
jgi:hypothetical protein